MKTLTQHARNLLQVNEVDADTRHEEPAPEVTLWRSVLLQALLDSTVSAGVPGVASIDRARAIAWIVASCGVTAEDFEDVCHLAQLNPDLFREHAGAMFKSGKRFVLRKESLCEPSGCLS